MTLNELFDCIPRTRLYVLGRETPAFRTTGVAGFYAAVLLVLGLGPLAGRSLLAMVTASGVCGLSFFGYALLRKALTGREELVLLEHVWVALLCSVGALWLMRLPILAHLDVVSIGLAFFLAFGRAGCLMVGCCHGHPCAVGIRYGEAAVRDGFAQYLVGVRLFPIQLVEGVGLVLIGLVLIPVLFLAQPGAALSTFIVSYSVLRFGLEGARADHRPHFSGLSQSRWMAIAELLIVVALAAQGHVAWPPSPELIGAATAVAAGLIPLIAWHAAAARRDRALFSAEHIAELREMLAGLQEKAGPQPAVLATSLGVRVGVSVSPADGGASAEGFSRLQTSISLAAGRRDPSLMQRLIGCLGDEAITAPVVLAAGAVMAFERQIDAATRTPIDVSGADGAMRAASATLDMSAKAVDSSEPAGVYIALDPARVAGPVRRRYFGVAPIPLADDPAPAPPR
jgi:Prolipoprotein diacylglyceryl transferase